MFRKLAFICALWALAPFVVCAQTVDEVVAKNVQAHGGSDKLKSVNTLRFSGKLDFGSFEARFVQENKRPDKVRFELQFNKRTAVQVYDGVNGWKLRPYLNRQEVEPYSAEEMKMASTQGQLDGFLIDYAAKGTRVELDGVEKVEGHDTYKLKLTLKTGDVTHVWVDSETFLEAKVEGQPRRLDGTYHPVEVYYRDYRAVNGLHIPFVLETKVLPVNRTATGLRDTPVPSERILIDKVTVNTNLEDSLFSKPQIPAAPVKGK